MKNNRDKIDLRDTYTDSLYTGYEYISEYEVRGNSVWRRLTIDKGPTNKEYIEWYEELAIGGDRNHLITDRNLKERNQYVFIIRK